MGGACTGHRTRGSTIPDGEISGSVRTELPLHIAQHRLILKHFFPGLSPPRSEQPPGSAELLNS